MPIFTNPQTFPSFDELPPSTSSLTTPQTPWFLLAQIKENMTITKPTLVVRDRSNIDFAVTFDDGDHHGLVIGGGNGEKARFRKGHTLVVPCATRTDRGEGKKALVRVPEGQGRDVRVLPTSLDKVFGLGALVNGEKDGEEKKRGCAACGKDEGGEGKLMRCTGCGVVAYCGTECQVRGWNELGHKADCKALKGIREIWP
ncbi:uncharacterized protein GGS22DRAFT_135588 [Annulohypoxylon maeteangense]|uniref:uncharacterized protein n=1 Tax=Annulohypoxylon maeteangense TaxID=1927788 RepID=UPI00200814A1|nr:uncharacterized protein GGS22DRAFT_135588 [Annulohypoxylon maeteangense]KAI0885890.1 hypothetical protein GGS22DRAFT_135588 [Annulohypoxylon maeteangense]